MNSLHVHWTFPDGGTQYVGELRVRGSAEIQEFTYDSAWLERGFSIGEGLPLIPGPIPAPGGASTFGVFDDAGPDSWGRFVITRTLPAERWTTSLGLLASVADVSRQGALRFSASRDSQPLNCGELRDVRSLSDFYNDIQLFMAGETDRALLRRIFAGSGSQGGARPKATLVDEEGGLVMTKFPSERDLYDVETCEAVAVKAASDAGLTVPEWSLRRLTPDRAVLLLRRFDRSDSGRVGYQSMRTASGLCGMDPYSYEIGAMTARYLSGDRGVEAVVGAAALSVCLHSVDDHPRNIGFLGGRDGWSIAPLFDVVPFPYEEQGTPLATGDPDRSLEHLLDIDWGLKRDRVAQIAGSVAQVARGAWERAPHDLGLDEEFAAASGSFNEAVCDFDTVLDGSQPRFSL